MEARRSQRCQLQQDGVDSSETSAGGAAGYLAGRCSVKGSRSAVWPQACQRLDYVPMGVPFTGSGDLTSESGGAAALATLLFFACVVHTVWLRAYR
jgi:hypothetical protein